MAAILPEMPDFVTSLELRQGPIDQDTIGWLNADCTDRGLIYARIHEDATSCTLARITLRSKGINNVKPQHIYFKEDLEPAISKLLRHNERTRIANDKFYGEGIPASNDELESPERKRGETDAAHATKRFRHEVDHKLESLIIMLYGLRAWAHDESDGSSEHACEGILELFVDALGVLEGERQDERCCELKVERQKKQALNQELEALVETLHTLQKRVCEDFGIKHMVVRRLFLELHGEILKLMTNI
ncbi:hypothetical protein D6D12_09908 [Aureobasidium pullulans]|uniref:Uncharacterized protein n=1 Tax=Aureobasidium pullulans TaxID=5580 RepID=A0AB74JEW2_AURPU|nr:hypothetical protein D6D12_09908 [Aureobasidium pullulans]THX51188.1 hypothetical protein D6D11_05119 [Aureobasidium pullulans]